MAHAAVVTLEGHRQGASAVRSTAPIEHSHEDHERGHWHAAYPRSIRVWDSQTHNVPIAKDCHEKWLPVKTAKA